MLAKQTKLVEHQLIPIPQYSKLSLYQWPILSVRYATAWSNWKVASGCWRSQVSKEEYPSPYVFGLQEGHECLKYAAENNWIPQDAPPIYDWEDIPQLAHDFFNGKINSYFPTFRVNPE
jgi:hypothetical protein